MADQGVSERRGTESGITPAGQTNTSYLWSTTSPASPKGISYFESGMPLQLGNDSFSAIARVRETSHTPIGVGAGQNSTEVSSTQGTAYTNFPLGTPAHDLPGVSIRAKEFAFTQIGTATPEVSTHGTSYTNFPIGLGTPIYIPFLYKLRAQDSGNANVYVYWVSLIPTAASANVSYIGPLINFTIMSVWQQGH